MAKYRAFIWFIDTNIDCEDFWSVHANTLEDLDKKIAEEKALIAKNGDKFLSVEFEEIIDNGRHSIPLYRAVA